MARRYSGSAAVDVRWDDDYRGFTDRVGAWRCAVSVDGRTVGPAFYVGRSHAGPDARLAVDCPEAYDGAARSALAFADAEHGSVVGCALEYEDHGLVVVRRSRLVSA
jgi:hypothetical protein